MSNLIEVIKSKIISLKQNEKEALNFREQSSDFDLSSRNYLKFKGQYKKIAAVFILLREAKKEVTVILTRRAKNLSSHPGQISFPGGVVEAKDATILSTALREVREEIGLSNNMIETIGALRPHETVSKFLIHPFVGIIDSSAKFKINHCEVAEIFEVPLVFLLNRSNMAKHKIQKEKYQVGYYAIPYGPYYIWGATARIIKSLTERFYS